MNVDDDASWFYSPRPMTPPSSHVGVAMATFGAKCFYRS